MSPRPQRSFGWLPIALATLLHGQIKAQIPAVVANVSKSQYQNYHLRVESMGLGQYGGAAYNQGFRNRDGWNGAGTLGNQEARLYLQNSFSSMGLGVSTQGVYRNVIGQLTGEINPSRILIVGAHYDHIGNDRPGGDDNASGTAAVLEAARVLSQYRFGSTIRFMGFNAEEDGLLGSANYVTSQVIPNSENIAGMINLDMILRPGRDSGTTVIDADLETRTSHAPSVALASQFRQVAATYVPSLVVDSVTRNVNGASDQDSFVSRGYPAIMVSENSSSEIYGGSNLYYHTFNDSTDRLANNGGSPNGTRYDFPFATDLVRAVVAFISQEAGLINPSDPCDFDADGSCGVADLNQMLLQGPIASGVAVVPGVNGQFDLTGDGVISPSDLDSWLSLAATDNGFGSPYRHGDANLDGGVDVTDFNLWNTDKFSSNLRWDHGDFNGDGSVDASDFNLWNANKFQSSDRSAIVPEPYECLTQGLLLILLSGVHSRR